MREELLSKLRALLIVDYMLSDESERIIHPEVDTDKYNLYLSEIEKCFEYATKYNLQVCADNPDFPKSTHMISLKFPTRDDLLEIRVSDMGLFNIIGNSDGVIMATDKLGDIEIDLFFNDIYIERG